MKDTQTFTVTTESGQQMEFLKGILEMKAGDKLSLETKSIWFAHGRIVFMFWGTDDIPEATLEEIARSIRFSPDAPTPLDEQGLSPTPTPDPL